MGLIVEKQGRLETVGALVAALQKFPQDMPIEVGNETVAMVYRVKPQKGETVYDRRGLICIDGDDGVLDD